MRKMVRSGGVRSVSFTSLSVALIASSSVLVADFSAAAQCGGPPIMTNQAGGPTTPDESVTRHSALPSSLVHYVHQQRYLHPDWNQKEIAWPLLEIARQDETSIKERFFWAQLNFMAFEAQAAYDLFSALKDRDDWYGWMARWRLNTMDRRAFENYDRLERNVAYERENFAFNPEYASITGAGERHLCGHWAQEGQHQRAVDLAVTTIEKTPTDAAYGTLYLVNYCNPSFEATGKQQQAIDLAQAAQRGLTTTLSTLRKSAGQHPAYDPTLYENIKDDSWYRRSELAPYNYQVYKVEQMISWFDDFLACRRDERQAACSEL